MDRHKAARTYIESVGGKLHRLWHALGEYDGCNTWEAPDSVSMAAVAIAISGGGIRQTWYKSVAALLRLDRRFA